MAEEKSPDSGAEQETDPFAGFQTESYDRGQREEEPAPEPPAEEEDEPRDDEDEVEESEDEEQEEERPAPKPKKTAQARFDELTRARREAERRAEALERRLEALEQARQAAQPEPQEEEAPAEPQGPPSPDDFTYGELDPRYIAALVDYQTEQRLTAYEQRLQAQQQATREAEAQRAVAAKFQKQVEKGQEKYDDYHDRVVLGAQRGEWPLSRELAEMIVDSDVGDDVAYHLASHPEEAAMVFRQSPTEQARYFGRMEAKLSATQTAATGADKAGESAAPIAPKAPAPVLPTRGAGGRFQPSADTDDFASFERLAMEK